MTRKDNTRLRYDFEEADRRGEERAKELRDYLGGKVEKLERQMGELLAQLRDVLGDPRGGAPPPP